MSLPNIFKKEVSDKIIQRINNLSSHKKPNGFIRFILKLIVKDKIVGEKPYSHNLKTAPQFIMSDSKNFGAEKNRLIDYINKTQNLGEDHFDNKENLSFDVLNKTEWNNMFYKHLDHHLSQFGV